MSTTKKTVEIGTVRPGTEIYHGSALDIQATVLGFDAAGRVEVRNRFFGGHIIAMNSRCDVVVA